MQFVSLNPEENKVNSINKFASPNLGNVGSQKSKIQQGMSTQEIADIVSDHLIDVIRKQFEIAEKEFDSK